QVVGWCSGCLIVQLSSYSSVGQLKPFKPCGLVVCRAFDFGQAKANEMSCSSRRSVSWDGEEATGKEKQK
ncbi:hypothetical protein ACLKA7_001024, partial [Drosophila subpalustris]